MRVRVTALFAVAAVLATGLLYLAAPGFRWLAGAVASAQERGGALTIPLRSFAPGARGSLTVTPGTHGGSARLVVSGLPRPRSLDALARAFVAWAVAGGGRELNLGEVKTDAAGNGSLEFTSPPLDRYTVIVTAEPRPDATRLRGAPVLSTRAGEVTPLFGPSPADTTTRQPARTETATGSGRRSYENEFYREIDNALRPAGSRTFRLVGCQVTPRASAVARVASRNGEIFVRAHFVGLPLPSVVGASVYSLWAVAPDGRTAYLGDLPVMRLNNELIYVRAPAPDLDGFGLLVTAEPRREAAQPSRRHALETASARSGPRRRRGARRKRRPLRRHASSH